MVLRKPRAVVRDGQPQFLTVAVETEEASSAPVLSCRCASATDTHTGPGTEIGVELERARPSSVQMAPVASQSLVCGRVMLAVPLPSGSTVMGPSLVAALHLALGLPDIPAGDGERVVAEGYVAERKVLAESEV